MSNYWKLTTAAEAPTQLEQLLEQSVRELEIEALHAAKFMKPSEIWSDYAVAEVLAELERATK